MSNQLSPLATTSDIVRLFGIVPPAAYKLRDLYEADRSKLIAVLRVCADGIDMMKQGSFADTFVFADDAELKAYADGILSQLKVIGVVPNK